MDQITKQLGDLVSNLLAKVESLDDCLAVEKRELAWEKDDNTQTRRELINDLDAANSRIDQLREDLRQAQGSVEEQQNYTSGILASFDLVVGYLNDDQLKTICVALVGQQEKIRAVRALRAHKPWMGLKESKDQVEAWYAEATKPIDPGVDADNDLPF